MGYVFATAPLAALLAIAAAACGGSEVPRPATPEGSTTSSAIDFSAVPPEPVSRVPEGMLLVQKESSRPAKAFGIGADGSISDYGRGSYFVPAPDGRHVAFRGPSERPAEVVLMTAEGRETFRHSADTLTGWPSMLWSPDGSRLAYTLPGGTDGDLGQAYVVNADGSGRRQLTENPANYSLAGWTAANELLAIAYPPQGGTGQARLLLIGGGRQEVSLPRGAETYIQFALSPDGKRVTAVTGDWEEGFDVWLMDLPTGKWRQIADMGIVARPSRGLFVSAGIPPNLEPPRTNSLLLKGPPPVMWSPDGTRIAYYRTSTGEGNAIRSELRVVDVTTGEDVSVAQDATWQGAWSPDGRHLAEPLRSPGRVVLMGPDGYTRMVELAASGIAWSPDGELVVAHASGLSIVEPGSGRTRETLTAEGEPLYDAEVWAGADAGIWSPSGRYLAFSVSRLNSEWRGALYVLDTRTGELTLLLEERSYYLPLAWLAG